MTRATGAAAPLAKGPRASGEDRAWPGLSEEEAARRLIEVGANELPVQHRRGLWALAFEVVREPMFLMLVAAGVLYLVMGEPADALMLLSFVIVVMSITIVQERRTERALEALRDLSSPRALVIRGGLQRRIPGREVVPGDVILLAEGDRVPADAILRSALHLAVDESLLTGESLPVRKVAAAAAIALDRPGGDDLPSVYSGTLVTSGQALAEVLTTAGGTELGKIGRALQQVQVAPTRLQRETARLVRTLALVGLSLCALVVVVYALTRGGAALAWKEGLLAGIAMAMATLPEEFPVVLTVFLALGAWRISRSQVLTRRMPAVETLGAATVLCVDKTGTLTVNQMALRTLSAEGCALTLDGSETALPEALHALLESAILASKRDPFDPMERALQGAGERLLRNTEHLHPEWRLLREFPLTAERLAVTHAWDPLAGAEAAIAVKGAPETVAAMCALTPERRVAFEQEVARLAGEGLRVLAVACGAAPTRALPEQPEQLGLTLVGLLGFADPLRSTVPAAVSECHAAGIRVVMITGDYPVTALSIARQAGLGDAARVMTGEALDALSDEDLARRVGQVEVFARVVPAQKLRIVNALKAAGEVVAMTGDGVNDAPALKAAHIGIAMGARGTDVAREAAALVLLDDDFSSIVAAVRLGRRIFDNIRKAVAFILAVHVPIAGLSMIPVLLGDWPLLLLPVHIVFLELVIDPSCSLVYEAEEAEPDVMRRPPRSPRERLFSWRTIGVSVLQGLSVLVVCLAVFVWARRHHSTDAARALTFASLVVASLMIILTNRSWSRTIAATLRQPNAALWWVVGGTTVLLAVVLLLPGARRLFHFAPIHLPDLALALGGGLTCVLWFELLKLSQRWGGWLSVSARGARPQGRRSNAPDDRGAS
ncbi:MAG: cation-translocating P-type ATPase [Proteobacteria bacterium]|nr:cation-translocating P-type ATPase [Pseudomonadota bacterium]